MLLVNPLWFASFHKPNRFSYELQIVQIASSKYVHVMGIVKNNTITILKSILLTVGDVTDFLSFFVSLSCHCCCGLLLASSYG
jgi:hypothetical protein